MTLTEAAAERYVAASGFTTGPAGFVGIAVELLSVPSTPAPRPAGGPGHRRLRHGFLTGRYDGVLTVSSPPSPGVDVAVRRTAQDLALVRDLLAADGFAPAERALNGSPDDGGPDDGGPAGGAGAYAGTAAVRVCLDAGVDEADVARRWAVANAVGPVLAAAFANSPRRAGRPGGWRSTRQALRLSIDRPLPAGAPRATWAAYALDSPTRSGATFRQLLRGPHPPGLAELHRHLDGLPAPVRARGHLELNMIDAQPGDGWQVAAAVAAVLVDDARAAGQALAATAELPADAWTRAARDGLADPLLAGAARHCLTIAYAALARQGTARGLRDAVAAFADAYTSRGLTPADTACRRARSAAG